ncbi:hypothetical protein ACWJJH_04715 [Endozoicomonadaceae bacterium StTr2]
MFVAMRTLKPSSLFFIICLLALFSSVSNAISVYPQQPVEELLAQLEAESDVQQYSQHNDPLPREVVTRTDQGGEAGNSWYHSSTSYKTPPFEESDFYKIVGTGPVCDPNKAPLESKESPVLVKSEWVTPVYTINPRVITREVANNGTHFMCSVTETITYQVQEIVNVEKEEIVSVANSDKPDVTSMLMMGFGHAVQRNMSYQRIIKLVPEQRLVNKPVKLLAGCEIISAYLEEAKRHNESVNIAYVALRNDLYYVTSIRLTRFCR